MVFEFLFVIQSFPAHIYNALYRSPLFWLYYMYNWPACLIPINDWYPMFQHDTISTADTLYTKWRRKIITSNTEIRYGETFGFLRYKIYILENNSCSKIYHVKKKYFFQSFKTKLCLFHITVTWARNRIDFFSFLFFYHFTNFI